MQKPRKTNITQKVAPMDKSTFSILFIMQKGKPNAEGNAPIFARITINHQMTHLATRYYLPPCTPNLRYNRNADERSAYRVGQQDARASKP